METKAMAARPEAYGRSRSAGFRRTRFAFQDTGHLWFAVPVALYEEGWAARLSSAELKRYVTLLRLSNRNHGARVLKVSIRELRVEDGIAERTARHVHGKLAERGLIVIDRTTRPFQLRLVDPDDWCEPKTYADPSSKTFLPNSDNYPNPWKRTTPS